MVRHAANEVLTALAGTRIERTLRIQADEAGVLELTPQLLAELREGDALELPDPLPTCEACWTEAAIAIAVHPDGSVTFTGAACGSSARQVGALLVLLVSS
jgi:hypothetical protein